MQLRSAPKRLLDTPEESNTKRSCLSKSHAYVPAPTANKLPPLAQSSNKQRSPKAQHQRYLRSVTSNTQKWNAEVPTFTLDVDWETLANRPKNSAKDKAAGEKIMEEMADWPADACSGRWTDRNGRLLLAYFADHIQQPQPSVDMAPTAYQTGPEGPLGRTEKDIEAARTSGGHIFRHGLLPSHIEGMVLASQFLHSKLHPKVNERDIRHPDEEILFYDINKEFIPREGIRYTPGAERTGVTHLVDAWFAQAHHGKNHTMTPSSDMFRSCSAAQGLDWYYEITTPVVEHLDLMFQASFPIQYQEYRAAFEAGQFVRNNPGPWLGRVVVHKVQVLLHQDGEDGKNAATGITNGGFYKGGELYLPDLRLKLKYKPGDVVIFLAGDLYHAVEFWEPSGPENSDGVTPGRVGFVFFSPEKSLKALKGKEKGWFRATFGGAWPSVKNLFQV